MLKRYVIYIMLIIFTLTIYGQSNLRYEKNNGQWDSAIKYKTSFKQGKVYALDNKINIIVFDSNNHYYHPHGDITKTNSRERYTIFSIQPYNANKCDIVSENICQGYSNYFLSKDKSKWKSKVPSYEVITYKNIYDNVDWEISSQGGFPKHSYIVHTNGDIRKIVTLYSGVINVTKKGNRLVIETNNGVIEENELFVYQKSGERIDKIESDFRIQRTEEGFLVSYVIGEYDRKKDLIIDPSLVFCTYSGSHSDNWGMTACYDKNGYMISGGIVYGVQYPIVEGSYDTSYSDNWDCVITKFDSLGQNLIFSTYLGGEFCEMPHSMIVNNSDDVIIFGTTGSGDFPTTYNAFQKTFNGGEGLNYEQSLVFPNGIDIFVSTLSSDGTDLLASTFVGGSNNDGFNFKNYYSSTAKTLYDGNDSLYANFGDCARGEVVIDHDNNVYIATCTFSDDFPTTNNAYKTSLSGSQDAVVFKMDKSLSQMIYSTYIGGTKDDAAYSIDLSDDNRAYVCGGTTSQDFPTSNNAYNTSYNGGNSDAFVCALSPYGDYLDYSTLFGSQYYDQAFFVRLDKDNFPYIFGQTKATGSTLIHNALYSIPNSGQMVAKFSKELDSLCFSTVFGSGDGIINISPSGFAVDICDRIYCAGWGRIFKYRKNAFGYTSFGTQNLETTSDAFSSLTDGMDFYIMSLSIDASQLDYATFFGEYSDNTAYGNDHVDGGTSRFDRYGNLYLTICASCGGSQGMPTTEDVFSSTNNSMNCNMSATKFSIHNDFAVADFTCPTVMCKESEVAFTNNSRGETFLWDFGDGAKSSQKNPTHTYTQAGEYTITLVANMNNGCKETDTIKRKILILDNTHHYLDTITVCMGKSVNIGIDSLSLNPNEEVYFEWKPANLLSDASVINPYATVTAPTLFTLIVKANSCQDTFYRFVDIEELESEIPDTLNYCSIPYIYEIENTLNRTLTASWDRNFTDIVPVIHDSVKINNFGQKYLYIKYSENGCYGIDSIYLNFGGIVCELHSYNVGCQSNDDGSAKVIVSSDKNNIHYKWSGNGITNSDTDSIGNLSVGTYSVLVYSDEDSCSSLIEFEISSSIFINIDAVVSNSHCEQSCNGQIDIDVSGGDAPYTFVWSNGKTEEDLTNLCSGDYTITVTDNAGCISKKTFSVANDYEINLSLTATKNNCLDGCSAKIISLASNGVLPYTYTWSNGQTTSDLTDVCSGEYTLNLKDANGCPASASVEVTYDDKFIDFDAWVDKSKVYDGERIVLSSTEIDDMYYSWSPSTYLDNPFNAVTGATIYETTTYQVIITDNKGCTKSDTVSVEVEYVNCGKPNIFIPNVFSPNNDGKNDVLRISGEYIDKMEWAIYDRWGERVFYSTSMEDGWDGKYHNNDCPSGVYYYKLEIKCLGGKTFLTGGDVTLIR